MHPYDIDFSSGPNLCPADDLLPDMHCPERRFTIEREMRQEPLEGQDDLGHVIFKKFPAKGEM
jgi:hypothetical protein